MARQKNSRTAEVKEESTRILGQYEESRRTELVRKNTRNPAEGQEESMRKVRGKHDNSRERVAEHIWPSRKPSGQEENSRRACRL